MPQSLREEIRQTRPFRNRAEEALLSVVRTASMLNDEIERVLRPAGLSPAQYNVLRILRGAGTPGLCRNELRDRLLTRMPDVTRLLDRMEEAGLVRRSREDADRRLVRTVLTPEGRQLVDSLDGAVEDEQESRVRHLGDEELATLIALLEKVRYPDTAQDR